jgi:DedD protein
MMANRMDRFQDENGPSARHLVLMFLAAVAVCAVFFSLGFVVGYNHNPSRVIPVTENISGSGNGNIPPTINPPAGGSGQASSQGMETENVSPGSASSPEPLHPQSLPPEPAATPQPKIQQPLKKPITQRKPRSKPSPPERKIPASRTAATSGSHFAVQVMASSTRADAENLVKLLKSHGYHVFILSPQQAQTKDRLYRVQVGPFSSRVDADRARDKLESEGFRPFVVR